MERLEFISPKGQIVFGADSPYKLESFENAGDGTVTRSTVQFMDTDGATLGNALYEPRTVTVKGRIYAKNAYEVSQLRQKLTELCDCKSSGTLLYTGDTGHYRAEAVAESLPAFGTKMSRSLAFVVYFILPGFYWQGLPQIELPILQTTPNLTFPFTFPGQFGYLTTRRQVANNSGNAAPCRIVIYGNEISQTTLSGTQGLEIVNHTAKSHLFIDHDITDDEVITIDTARASVTSSKSGNLLHKIKFSGAGDYPDYETDLAMKLLPGMNDFECMNLNPARLIRVEVQFYTLFLGV